MNEAGARDNELAPLREDLQLHEGPIANDGSCTWTIYDPIRNRHFRIGWAAFEAISRWHAGSVEQLINAVAKSSTCRLTQQDVADIARFLSVNSLSKSTRSDANLRLLEQYRAAQTKNLAWLSRNALFVRVPILRAERLLMWLYRFCWPFFTRSFRNLVLVLGVVGIYFVARQWDIFISSFEHFFTWSGVLLFVLALISIKVVHEFAHGLMATRFGAHVSNMGIALMVFFPVLYTDVSDVWRIRSRRQRLLVGAAGVLAELYVALICTFLWCFLPDGTYRSAAFFLATTSWVFTLAININPFLKFDGYYLLSDWWSIENLQERAFALGRWCLRELLFCLREDPPEVLAKSVRRRLILYAWGTWIYRFLLFLTISYVVFTYFFKLAGVVLLILTSYRFIFKPLSDEFKVWLSKRGPIMASPRSYVTLSLVALVAVLCVIPWDTRVKAPAILIAEERTKVFPPMPSRVEKLHVGLGQRVGVGDLLVELTAPDVDVEIAMTARRIELAELKLERRAAGIEERANTLVLGRELEEQREKFKALQAERTKLHVRAPISGTVVGLDKSIHVGRWISPERSLLDIAAPASLSGEAFLSEIDLARVAAGDNGRFLADEPEIAPIDLTVASIEQANLRELHIPYLESTYGGPIAVRKDTDGASIPEASIFRLSLSVESSSSDLPSRVLRGVAVIEGAPTNFARRAYERVAAVLIRESGF